jgi:hypothetical protein
MTSAPTLQTWDNDPDRERITRIEPGMQAEDAIGERIGKVADIHIGGPDSIDIWNPEFSMPDEAFNMATGARLVPNVPAEIVDRMLQIGYIKIDDKRHFRRDHHYYATADEIVSVEANTVRLSKVCDELTTPLD